MMAFAPCSRGVLHEQFVGVLARFLAKVGKDGDISADDGLQSRSQVPDDAARPDDDAAYDSIISNDAVAGDFESRGHHCEVHTIRHLFPPEDGRLPVRFYLHTQSRASADGLLFSKGVEILFYILAIPQILLGLYLIGQGVQWLGYARRRIHTDPGFYSPKVAVLCPCRGMEPALERNLVSLTEFEYQGYEIFFLIASASDPAYNVVKRVAATSRAKAHVVLTEKPDGCGEKVNNLRLGILQLPPDFEVFVFVDSDGRPGKNWLHRMVAPLADSRIGATTTMRWLIPNRNNLATALLAAWNAPIVTMLSEKGKNFCWGGGTAILRSVFDQSGVAEAWRHSVSDDYSMTRALEQAGRSIVFLPECIVPSFVETDFTGLMEFTNRQVLITRIYAEKMWRIAGGTHCFTV